MNFPSNKKLLEIYEKMSYIRNFEEEVIKAYNNKFIRCPIYLSIGQEAISSTISSFFKPDLIFAQHRSHSVYLAYGGNREKLVDELLGMDSGCIKGKGGSSGIQDLNIGMMGYHGLIGENVPIAVGAALGDPSKKVLCVFGDGAAEEDYVFTAITFASTHKLPVFFVCEDNNLAILTKKSERRNWELSDVLKNIDIFTADIEDDPFKIANYLKEVKNKLPAFINCKTCRHKWHAGTGQDGEPKLDRLALFRKEIVKKGLEKEIYKIEQKTKKEAEELWRRRLEIQ